MVKLGSPTFLNVQFADNIAEEIGGAIAVMGGITTVSNAKFLYNTARKDGGAAAVKPDKASIAKAHVYSSVFHGNQAATGGALYIYGSNPEFDQCIFSENKAQWGGGVAYIIHGGRPAFSRSQFHNNSAYKYGGAIFTSSPGRFKTKPSFNACNFSFNNAYVGGAVYNSQLKAKDSPTCENLLDGYEMSFSRNSAVATGGAIFLYFEPDAENPVCRNVTSFHFDQNSAARSSSYGTTAYKLAVQSLDKSFSPGTQIKGVLEVQDLFGTHCVELSDTKYPGVRVEQEKNGFHFTGVTNFPIEPGGLINLTYLETLKPAPVERINTYFRLRFSQPSLQSVEAYARLGVCKKGRERSESFIGSQQMYECLHCSAPAYSVKNGVKCRKCPVEGAECLGGDMVYIKPGFYGSINGDKDSSRYGEILVFSCPSGACCTNVTGLSYVAGPKKTGFGCLIQGHLDCAINRNASVMFCGSCKNGYSEVFGSEICLKCESIGWWWFVLPVPALTLGLVYLFKKKYDDRSTVFSMATNNLVFFYQTVPLVIDPWSLVKKLTAPLLATMNLNFEAGAYGDSKEGSVFRCILPGLTGLGKLLLGGLYPVFVLIGILWPLAFVTLRNRTAWWKNAGPAFVTCVMISYLTVVKTLVALVNCRYSEGRLHLLQAGKELCFEGLSWLWQGPTLFLLIAAFYFPYGLWKKGLRKAASRQSVGLSEDVGVSWTVVLQMAYRDECWWFESINLIRRLLLVTVAALPMERGLKLFCLTMTIMIMICIQIAMKPFRNNALNFAETFFLITLNAIGLATSSEMPEKDVIQVGLVLLPALHVCLVSCWSRFYADSFGENGVPLRKQSYVELKKQEHTRRCAKAKIGKPGNDDEYVQL